MGDCGNIDQIGVKGGAEEPNVTKDVTKELTEKQLVILEMIIEDSFVTISEMSLKTGVATRTIIRDIENLQSSGISKVASDMHPRDLWSLTRQELPCLAFLRPCR